MKPDPIGLVAVLGFALIALLGHCASDAPEQVEYQVEAL